MGEGRGDVLRIAGCRLRVDGCLILDAGCSMQCAVQPSAKGIGFIIGSNYFYFATLSEKNILFEFQKVVILIEKMS